jgi:cation:H+ antiporter
VLFIAIFLAASALIIWRLEAMNAGGFEGTVLGTLIMPYCSGIGNLMFAFIEGPKADAGTQVIINSLTNNVTNMTLLIGFPAIFWRMTVSPPDKTGKSKSKKRDAQVQHKVNRLTLLLTLTAGLFFCGAVWVLSRDKKLDATDGLILVGLFLFWQCFHVFEVLKSNARQNKSLSWTLPFDLALLGVGAVATYLSTDCLVKWIGNNPHGFIHEKNIGLLTGWLMVVPNALLAFYYGWRGNPEVVYTSQVGDGHICIPLCVGVAALFHAYTVPAFFDTSMIVLAGATVVHFICVALFGGLPRIMGGILFLAYIYFLWRGLLK